MFAREHPLWGAAWRSTPEQEVLFRSLVGRRDEIDPFLGVLVCAVPVEEYFSLRNLMRLIGVRGLLAIRRARFRGRRLAEMPPRYTGAAKPHASRTPVAYFRGWK